MRDPNPIVDGSGIDYLKRHHIEVEPGVLEEQCRAINLPFLKHIASGLPYVVMKAGISLDGKLNYEKGKRGGITGPESGRYVHRLRDRLDAILVGWNTVCIDDPSLTTRLPNGRGRDPVRIVLDRELQTPLHAQVFSRDSGAYCWVFCGEKADAGKVQSLQEAGIKVTQIPLLGEGKELDLSRLAKLLGEAGICSVLVEGGAAVHGSFLRQRLFDYAYLFQAPLFAGDEGVSLISGYSAKNKEKAICLKEVKRKRLGKDVALHGALLYP
jgi:diaminohydroxyphosphoribosylaminopyrimidine deaminase/5-amino-6-(5-phosphoribosylamino)uracil reductase